ncbi:DnaB-like helicase C-terminal domain-containing protein [Candidatus Phytoplasma solani]|uniref:DnaB-like helicase C-terminal domain-containing protein n=1 Tax=Candidatus Phytoplasma solani TaxID=69896 RepID=UPI0033130687
MDAGFSQLNSASLDFQSGNLIILAARPGMSKSTLMINLAINITKKSKIVAIFSLGTTNNQFTFKML